MEVASALIDASNKKLENTSEKNNSNNSWIGSWFNRSQSAETRNTNVVVIDANRIKNRRQKCQEAEEALAGGPNKVNIFMSF